MRLTSLSSCVHCGCRTYLRPGLSTLHIRRLKVHNYAQINNNNNHNNVEIQPLNLRGIEQVLLQSELRNLNGYTISVHLDSLSSNVNLQAGYWPSDVFKTHLLDYLATQGLRSPSAPVIHSMIAFYTVFGVLDHEKEAIRYLCILLEKFAEQESLEKYSQSLLSLASVAVSLQMDVNLDGAIKHFVSRLGTVLSYQADMAVVDHDATVLPACMRTLAAANLVRLKINPQDTESSGFWDAWFRVTENMMMEWAKILANPVDEMSYLRKRAKSSPFQSADWEATSIIEEEASEYYDFQGQDLKMKIEPSPRFLSSLIMTLLRQRQSPPSCWWTQLFDCVQPPNSSENAPANQTVSPHNAAAIMWAVARAKREMVLHADTVARLTDENGVVKHLVGQWSRGAFVSLTADSLGLRLGMEALFALPSAFRYLHDSFWSRFWNYRYPVENSRQLHVTMLKTLRKSNAAVDMDWSMFWVHGCKKIMQQLDVSTLCSLLYDLNLCNILPDAEFLDLFMDAFRPQIDIMQQSDRVKLLVSLSRMRYRVNDEDSQLMRQDSMQAALLMPPKSLAVCLHAYSGLRLRVSPEYFQRIIHEIDSFSTPQLTQLLKSLCLQEFEAKAPIDSINQTLWEIFNKLDSTKLKELPYQSLIWIQRISHKYASAIPGQFLDVLNSESWHQFLSEKFAEVRNEKKFPTSHGMINAFDFGVVDDNMMHKIELLANLFQGEYRTSVGECTVATDVFIPKIAGWVPMLINTGSPNGNKQLAFLLHTHHDYWLNSGLSTNWTRFYRPGMLLLRHVLFSNNINVFAIPIYHITTPKVVVKRIMGFMDGHYYDMDRRYKLR